MPRAGFYLVQAATLKFGSDGHWYADDEPVTHQRLARLFSRYLRRKASGGYEIWIDERNHADVEVQDAPYVVTSVSIASGAESDALASSDPTGFTLNLNDETNERLDPDSLQVGAGNVLYCQVKGGTERARFLRPAYYQLAQFIEEAGGGEFRLRCGSAAHTISQR
ncbi:MAG: hypothetical protein ACHQ9S_08285 [Candidatus Binatia bacterium]